MAKLVAETGMAELKMEFKDHVLRIRRKANSPAAAEVARSGAASRSNPEPNAVEEDDQDFGVPVVSQYVGILQLTHPKTSQPLVEVGHQVEGQQCLGWVESMGIRHELISPRAGTVAEMLAEAGEPVEYGQVLMLIQ